MTIVRRELLRLYPNSGRRLAMALLYLSVGIFLGGLSAVLAMTMFFVAKETDEGQHDLLINMGSVTERKDPF